MATTRGRDRGSRTAVDPAVLLPGEDDLLDVEPGLVERDLLDERLDIVAAPRGEPLTHAVGSGVVGGQRQTRIVELAHQAGEESGAELDVEDGIVEVAARRHQARGR